MVFINKDRKLNDNELVLKNAEFFSKIFPVPEVSEAVLKELKDFFKESSPVKDWEYRASYFRWYTILLWRRLNFQPRDLLLDVAIARQVPMAILLDIDMWREMMWYLASWVQQDYEDLKIFYSKIRKSFLESEAILGSANGKQISLAQAVQELMKIEQRGSDSIEIAEFNNKLHELLSVKNDQPFSNYIFVNPDEAVVRLVDTINFFIGVEPGNIWYMVDAFAHPEEIENEVYISKDEKENSQASVVRLKKIGLNLLEQIKSQIESEFQKDTEGNFENIEGVMARLTELAEKYNDPAIAEMVYFDEAKNKFVWKVQ